MNKEIIYGITGILDKPDDVINAAKKLEEADYKKYDIHTPYPLHGIDKEMRLKPSPLGYFALAFGLTGAITGLFIMWLTMSQLYPQIISGKPFFPLPALIPVTFEITVLLASVGTVLSMLFFLFKLPNNSHPLHDTDYMKKVSADKFGVCIEAKDVKFDLEECRKFLESINCHTIEPIYYPEETINFRPKIFETKFVMFLLAAAFLVSGATYVLLNKLMFVEPFNWMMFQQRLDAQYPTKFFKDGFSMRTPIEGTVARGTTPYLYKGNPEKAGTELVNPIEATKENLAVGKAKFDTYCSPCHGYQGNGDARLNGQFPNPPSLHSEKVRNWTDGRIYAVIMDGQNSMPSYASQIKAEDRWKVINYIRTLQRALNAKEEDLK